MFISHRLIRKDTIELRHYQENIVKTALLKNTLVVAPTALGKTVIAVLLSANFLEKYPDKKVLILAPTRPLAAQHAERFKGFVNMDDSKIALLTGHTRPQKRVERWRASSIVSATPHVVLNDITKGLYSPSDVSLVVFDEAHRAVGDYPYPAIASILDCRILGLTASPGGDAETIKKVCENLRIEKVEIRDERDEDVTAYVKGFEIEWKKISLPEPYLVVRNLLFGLLREMLTLLKSHGAIKSAGVGVSKKELLTILKELQKSVAKGHRKDLYPLLSAVSASLTIAHALDLLETQGIGPLYPYLNRTIDKARSPGASKALKDLSSANDFRRVVALSEKLKKVYVDPKFEALKEIICETTKETRIIVFTQYRDTAKLIVEALNDIEGIRAVRFVGQASKEDDPGLSQKEQLTILNEFRQSSYNVLVATSVAEEGLDIPSVDLVIFYEPVPSEIRSIQRRGRTGRTSIGRVVVLLAKDTRDEGVYWSSVARERRMKKSLRTLGESPDKKGGKKITE